MAKITISGMEDKNKIPVAGTAGTTGTTGTTGTAGTAGTTGTAGTVKKTEREKGGSISPIIDYLINKETEQKYNPEYVVGGTGVNLVNQSQADAEKSISQLKSDYAKQLRDNYNYSAEKLKNERDAALRESWVAQQKEEASLPERMAAAGINGGAAETSLAALKAKYQGNRNDIRSDYIGELGDLGVNHQNLSADAQRQYDEQWLEYLLSLAKIEEQAKYG